MRSALRLGALGILSVLLVTGCGARSVRVVQLQNDYDRYDDKTVSVSGVVTDSWGIPLVPFQLYKVDDGTGEITVLLEFLGRTIPVKVEHWQAEKV